MLVLYVTWPPDEEYINVVVSYQGAAGDAGAEIFIIAGKDKHDLGTFRVGDRQRLRLIPGRAVVRADERVLRMQYHPLDQASMHGLGWHYSEDGTDAAAPPGWWLGPELPEDVSYRIAIDIRSDGQVTHNYCTKPCKLEQRLLSPLEIPQQ